MFATFQRYLFESQGPHLDLPRQDQSASPLCLIGSASRAPPPPRWSFLTFAPVPQCQICERSGIPGAGEAKEEPLVQALRNEACVQVAPGEFIEPTFVHWTDPELGTWTRSLPVSHRQYQAFYDRVGVQESPTPDQLEKLLRRISRASGNDPLGDEDKAVVHRCWELLDEQLLAAGASIGRLSAVKSVVGPRGLLEKPELLLFVDGRRLAEKILLISQNLIRRDRATQRALRVAGYERQRMSLPLYVDDSSSSPTEPSLPLFLATDSSPWND